MRLVIDALELCYAREHIDTFVIASGDSDFVPLANKLRENDKFVIGLGVKQATSPVFVKACDEFIYLRTERRAPPEKKEEKRDKKEKSEKSEKPARGESAKPTRGVLPQTVKDVLQSLLERATGPLNPSFIKETIVRREPDFDERDHGFSSLSRMLEAAEREGLCQRVQQGRQWYVVSKESGRIGAQVEAEEPGRIGVPVDAEDSEI